MTQSIEKASLTAIILTHNESQNIADCLAHLDWVDDVVIVDSFSQDETLQKASVARADIRIFQNTFSDFGQQRNWALDHCEPKHEWILFVDADERITEGCAGAIVRAVGSPRDRIGFYLCYRNIFLRQWIRHCTMFPSWQLRLLRRGRVRFEKAGHGQREVLDGPVGYIRDPYDHLDLSKGMTEWIAKHNIYSTEEAELLRQLQKEPLKPGDLWRGPIERRRCLKRIAARYANGPVACFVYLYFIRLGLLDGRAGRTYCLLRAAQQIHIRAKMLEGSARI